MKKSDIVKMRKLLRKHYPNVRPPLRHKKAIQLLVATILSAQCTDKRVNKVTPALFKRYKTVRSFADADLKELEGYVRSTGFYRNKAKNIKKCCTQIMEKHGGKVPSNMDDLMELAGVARKTANCIMWGWFDKTEGVVVDTHVKRLSNRLGLTEHHDPVKIEKDLMEVIPRKDWGPFSLELIFHGRAICEARKPKCSECFLNKLCPSAFTFKHNKK